MTNKFIFRENTQFFLKIFCSSGDIVDTLNNDLANCCCIIVSFAYWNIFKFYAVFCLDTNKRKRWEYETATSPISFDTFPCPRLEGVPKGRRSPWSIFYIGGENETAPSSIWWFFQKHFYSGYNFIWFSNTYEFLSSFCPSCLLNVLVFVSQSMCIVIYLEATRISSFNGRSKTSGCSRCIEKPWCLSASIIWAPGLLGYHSQIANTHLSYCVNVSSSTTI